MRYSLSESSEVTSIGRPYFFTILRISVIPDLTSAVRRTPLTESHPRDTLRVDTICCQTRAVNLGKGQTREDRPVDAVFEEFGYEGC